MNNERSLYFEEALLSEFSSANWENYRGREVNDSNIAQGSTKGPLRGRLEDRQAVAYVKTKDGRSYVVAVVCDGVGGSDCGDVAATVAVASVIASLAVNEVHGELPLILNYLIRRADDSVRSKLEGAGLTTISIVIFDSNGGVAGASIGDSRIYTWGHGAPVVQVTEDDTLENELRKLNVKDASALARKGLLGSLSQAIGEVGRTSDELRVKVYGKESFKSSIAIASDGCWKQSGSAFFQVVLHAAFPVDLVRRILALANWVGGVDNASIISIKDAALVFSWCNAQSLAINNGGSYVKVWYSDQVFVILEKECDPDSRASPKRQVKRLSKSKAKKSDADTNPQMELKDEDYTIKRVLRSKRPQVRVMINEDGKKID